MSAELPVTPDRTPEAEPPAEPPSRTLRQELDDLRRRVELSDQEIDVLQVDVARHEVVTSTPWYRDPRILVAYIALLFSFGTTVVSYVRLDQDKQHEARTELTGYIQRLEDLPRVAAENRLQYGDAGSSALSGYITAEAELIANQARAVIAVIPNQVSTVEYVTVGYAFQTTGNFEQASEMYQAALKAGTMPQDKVMAYRALANIRFVLDDPVGGRAYFTQARTIYTLDKDAPAIVVATEDEQTELQWALDEITLGNCTEAAGHIEKAQALSATLLVDNGLTLLNEAQAQLQACSAPPASGGAPSVPPASF
jgi:tetratricopeptide (TPR) repeat protein